MNKNFFEGWYFKHQKEGETIAFIPGHARSGAFVQYASNRESEYFEVPKLDIIKNNMYAGECVFSESGISVKLPDICGEITYGPLKRLRSDIMGPFRFLPLQCRHGVISMRHDIKGKLRIHGREVCFDGGLGYIEKDSGTSFPKDYLWLQCGSSRQEFDIMLSIAHIPFALHSFTGCICAVIYEGREYRFATYNGVKLLFTGPKYIRLSQVNLMLEIEVSDFAAGQPLKAPVKGQMANTIRESNNVSAEFRLRESGRTVFDFKCDNVGYEYVKTDTENI